MLEAVNCSAFLAQLVLMTCGSSRLGGVRRQCSGCSLVRLTLQPRLHRYVTELTPGVLHCEDLHEILHRSTFSPYLRANYVPAVFYSETTMAKSLSKHPPNNCSGCQIRVPPAAEQSSGHSLLSEKQGCREPNSLQWPLSRGEDTPH